MFPYSDLPGIARRSLLRRSYFNDVEAQEPGFTVQSIASHSSSINARMRKRYGLSGTLPFGQAAPLLLAALASFPAVTLIGRPVLGSFITLLELTTGGPLGTGVFKWSTDNGTTWVNGILTAASVPLGVTGMTALFPAGVYPVGAEYGAAPPVPEAVLKWLAWLVTEDVATKHGISSNDPLAIKITEKAQLAEKQIEEAANTKDGLWDLPTSEDEASAIDTGGPLGYSEQSPYVWTYRQQEGAMRDVARFGIGCGPNRLVGS
jgi:hypothetical protein